MNMQVSSSSAQGQSLRGATLDPKRFRSVMGTFATGVAVIATEWNGELFGATVNSQTSVSLQPCMLLFFASEGSATGAAIRRSSERFRAGARPGHPILGHRGPASYPQPLREPPTECTPPEISL